jgi:hypothetical protein
MPLPSTLISKNLGCTLYGIGITCCPSNRAEELHMSVQENVEIMKRWFQPRWSPQKRPMVVRAKTANGRGRGLGCFTLRLPVQASRFLCANSVDGN